MAKFNFSVCLLAAALIVTGCYNPPKAGPVAVSPTGGAKVTRADGNDSATAEEPIKQVVIQVGETSFLLDLDKIHDAIENGLVSMDGQTRADVTEYVAPAPAAEELSQENAQDQVQEDSFEQSVEQSAEEPTSYVQQAPVGSEMVPMPID